MPPQPVKGFPLPDDFATTRIPNAVLGRVLTTIEDADEIKLVLRALWLLEHQRGYPRYITHDDLRRDRVLSVAIPDQADFNRILKSAIERGIFIQASINNNICLMFNTESARRASIPMPPMPTANHTIDDNLNKNDNSWDTPAASTGTADAFRAYEENIGILSPMIRQSILAALEDFTDEDITHAVRIAVENESRSWSYVSGILRRWTNEGIPSEQRSEQLERRPDERDVSEVQLNRYIEYLRRQQRSTDPS